MKYNNIPKACQSCIFVVDIIPKDRIKGAWHCECLIYRKFRLKCGKRKVKLVINKQNRSNEEV